MKIDNELGVDNNIDDDYLVLEDNPSGVNQTSVRSYAHQLTKAVAWCHARDIIHRK